MRVFYIMEQWKDIENYEGLYEISNYGRVKSLERMVKRGLGKAKLKTRILIPQKCSNGYLFVQLCNSNKPKIILVHRLVAIHFVEGYAEGLEVNHKDLDKKNNHHLNLEWVTKSQNHKHLYQKNKEANTIGAIFKSKGEANPRSILHEGLVKLIREQCSSNEITRKEASQRYGVSISAINSLVLRKTWRHI